MFALDFLLYSERYLILWNPRNFLNSYKYKILGYDEI